MIHPRHLLPRAAALAFLLAALAGPALLRAGGLVLLQDDKPLNGPVNWTADGKLAITPPGKTTQTFDLKDVRTAVIDAKAPPAPNTPEEVPWQKKELGRDRPQGTITLGATHIAIRDNLPGIHFNSRNADAASFIYQKLDGDCELVARILPKDDFPRTRAGLMIREGFELDAPMIVLLRGGEGGPSRLVSVFGGRETSAANSEQFADSKAPVFGACWLKLIRTADTFIAYDSVDGKKWNEIGSKRIPFDQQKTIYAGVCSAGYGKDGFVAFEKVSMTTPLQSAAAAPVKRPNTFLVTRAGSILAVDLVSVADNALNFRHAGDAGSIGLRDVLRYQFHVLARTAAEKLDKSPPGVMTSDGDFIEGEIQAIDETKIRLSSISFGITTLERNKADAVVFHESPAAAATKPAGGGGGADIIEVRLQDNSVLQAKSLTLDKDRILIEDLQAGPLRVPPKDIILFDRKK